MNAPFVLSGRNRRLHSAAHVGHTQWAALRLIVIPLGAVYVKVVEWETGFWGEKSSGWHYDQLFIVMDLTIGMTGGGFIALLPMR